MTLPPNLPAKNCFRISMKQFAHVKPWRPPEDKITESSISEAKVRIALRHNYEESIARRKDKAEAMLTRFRKKYKINSTPEQFGRAIRALMTLPVDKISRRT